MNYYRAVVRRIRPVSLFGILLTSVLGTSLAKYLNRELNLFNFLVSLAWVSTLTLGSFLLSDYFIFSTNDKSGQDDKLAGISESQDGWLRSKQSLLLTALSSYAVLASLSVMIIRTIDPNPLLYWVMLICFTGSFLISMPLIRKITAGYWELAIAILIAFFCPLFGLILQDIELQSLFTITTFPVFMLLMAIFLTLEISQFAVYLRNLEQVLVIRMGWQRAMFFHNILILSAYFLLGLASLFGLPRFILYSALISLPSGLLQIWQMWRISEGSRTNWPALIMNAKITYALLVYLMIIGYWIY